MCNFVLRNLSTVKLEITFHVTSALSSYDASNVSVLKWINVLSRGDPHSMTSEILVENLNKPVTGDQAGRGLSFV